MPLPEARFAVLLFTDLVGSTQLKVRHGLSAYAAALQRHNALFENLARGRAGMQIIQHTGDGYFAVFAGIAEAVRFALLFQDAMRRGPWPDVRLTTRVGLHAGEVADTETLGQPNVVGPAADVAARVMSLAVGGQILLTRTPFDEARHFVREHPPVADGPAPALRWLAHGPYRVQGLDEPIDVFEVGADGLAPLSPPLDSDKVRRAIRAGEEETLGWRPALGLEIPGRAGWHLTERLGAGGFGEVWVGEQTKLRQRRAFKFCFDDERLRALKREVTLVRLLRSALGERDDIVHLHELKLDAPPFYLESDLAPHGNLLQWAESQGGLDKVPLAQRIALVTHTATALAAAHSIGVLHKDIKPTNILIFDGPGGEPRPRLVDFGIGTLADPAVLGEFGVTAAGFTQATNKHSTGTPTYSPPEYLAGKPYTIQGDIYGLGVLLYQLVTAKPMEPLAQGWERDIPDPLLREDIAACVDGDPTRRLPSAADLAERLDALDRRSTEAARLRDSAALAVRERTARERANRLGTLALGFGVLAIAAVGGALFGWAGFAIAKEEKARKQQEVEKAQNAEQDARDDVLKNRGEVESLQRELDAKNTESSDLRSKGAQFDRISARELGAQGRYADALAYLARACADVPAPPFAAEQAIAFANLTAFSFPLATLEGHEQAVRKVQFSPDGARLATTCADGIVRIWDAANGSLLDTLQGDGNGALAVRFSKDAALLVPAPNDEASRIQAAPDAKPAAPSSGRVGYQAYSSDGMHIVTAFNDGTARVSEASTGVHCATLSNHTRNVIHAEFSTDGTRLATASDDQTACIWDTTNTRLGIRLSAHENAVNSAAFSPDGARLVTASGDGTACIWNSITGKRLVTFSAENRVLSSAQFSPDGARVLTIGDHKTVCIWDALSGRILASFSGKESDVECAQFSPDGMRIVVTSNDNTARVLDGTSGQPLVVMSGHEHAVRSALFSPDGLRIVTASNDHTARVWNAHTGEQVAVIYGHERPVVGAQFSPDGSTVITASFDKTARKSNAITGALVTTFVGHEQAVRSARFSPDGARVITASDDQTVRIWDAAGGKCIATLRGHEMSAVSAQFSPDGMRAVSASDDHSARVWEVLGTTQPTPQWFSSFLRLLGTRALDGDGELVQAGTDEWLSLKAAAADTTRYGEIARWYLTPGPDKPVRPGAKMTCREAADSLISPDTEKPQLEHAYELHPAHPLVHIALARFEPDATRAEFLRQFSLERLLPKATAAEQPALWRRAAELLDLQAGQQARAAALRERAK